MSITRQKPSIACKVLALMCCMAGALSAATSGLFTYTDNGTSITITDYPTSAVGAVDIPATIIGKPVTGIGSMAFMLCSGVTSVTIPSSVTSIGDSAFSSCSKLTGVTIPASVTSIGGDAFSYCTGMTAFTVDGLNPVYSSLNGVLFNKNQTTLIQCPGGKTGSVTIPSGVTSIEPRAFSYCTGLTDVAIPAGVTSIGQGAFSYCAGLTGVTIPAGVTSIGGVAFASCDNLTAITVDPLNTAYNSTDGVLYDKSQTTLIQCPGGKTGSVAIPASVTSLGNLAFGRCTHLAAITVDPLNAVYSSLDGFLLNKDQTSFIQCPGGKTGSVAIPAGVTSIGSGAFNYCPGLTGITIPSGVTSIGSYAFYQCTSLTSITIPSGVTSIEWGTFQFCTSLTSIRIPSGVTSIGSYAFHFCTSLTSITIPASVTSIGDFAIHLCFDLAGVYFLGNAPTLGFYGFDFPYSGHFTVYYLGSSTGFTSPIWQGCPSVNLGNPTPAANWLITNGYAHDADLQTDPDGDGVSLLMAYALNLDPRRNLSNSMPRPALAGNQLSLTFYAGNTDVSYAVETSTDLRTWSTAGVTLSAPDGNNRLTATIPATGPQRYMRLVTSY